LRELILNASEWRTKGDVYKAFFLAVGAPSWHGANLDALNDSIGTGQINEIEVPYRLVFRGKPVSAEAEEMMRDFMRLLTRLAENGCPVEFKVESSQVPRGFSLGSLIARIKKGL
jgi:RNAse (barnase) inhibitor barstar